jgi:hypothetical protein
MRNGSYETLTVETVTQKLPEAREYLRAARIDNTSRYSLREACATASVESDELLAKIEARMRRQARRTAPVVANEELNYA